VPPTEKKKPESGAKEVDAYLAQVPKGQRAALETLRKTIRSAAPKATETISYGMPAFKLDGRFLVSYAAWKKHSSLYPVSAFSLKAVGEDPAKFDVSKGTLRFPPTEPPPASLVRKLVKDRIADERARAAEKKRAR
jgi:uncharacterized protein YdhG (YjbR/CyaY superfamily)